MPAQWLAFRSADHQRSVSSKRSDLISSCTSELRISIRSGLEGPCIRRRACRRAEISAPFGVPSNPSDERSWSHDYVSQSARKCRCIGCNVWLSVTQTLDVTMHPAEHCIDLTSSLFTKGYGRWQSVHRLFCERQNKLPAFFRPAGRS